MFRFLWATGTPLSGHRFLFWMMATTAAIAYTAEAMELIAAQMLSVGLLLSIDNYYNNKVCKVIKGGGGDTPCIPGLKEHCPAPSLQGLSSGAHAASLIYGPRQLRRSPLPRSPTSPPGQSSCPTADSCATLRQASRPECLPAGIILTCPRHSSNCWARARLHIHISPGVAMPSRCCIWQTSRRRDRLLCD